MQVRVQKTIQGFREGLISEEVTLERLHDWLNNFDEVLRADSIQALVTVGGSAAAHILLDFLSRCAWRDSKLDAIKALGNFRGEEDVLPVLARWSFDNDIEIAQEAILALGNLGLKGAVDVLIEVLKHEPPQKKLQTIYGLGKLGSPRAVPSLLAELEGAGETNPLLTETLLLSLTDLRSHSAVEAMRGYVRSIIPGVRHSAVTGLGKVARAGEGVEKLLIPLIDDPDVLTGNLASWALFTIKTREHREPWEAIDDIIGEKERALRLPLIRDLRLFSQKPVLDYLKSSRVPAKELLEILYELETPEALAGMVDILVSEPEEGVQLEAARLLSHCGAGATGVPMDHCTATPGLSGLLTIIRAIDEGPEMAKVLFDEKILAQMGQEDVTWLFRYVGRAVAALRHQKERLDALLGGVTEVMAHEDNHHVLRAATICMSELTEGPGMEAALAGLGLVAKRQDISPEWRYQALARLGSEEAAEALFMALESERDINRLCLLVRLAGQVKLNDVLSERLTALLATLMSRKNSKLTERCIELIGKLKCTSCVPLVLPYLEEDDYRLVQAAVIALGNIGEEGGVEELGRLLGASDRRILGRTLHALSQIGGDFASETLLEFIAAHPWDEEFGDKVLRSVDVPAPERANHFVELVEVFEERTGSLTLLERANRYKLAVLESNFRRHFGDKKLEESPQSDEEGPDVEAGIQARVALARTLVSSDESVQTGCPSLCFALSQCCRAMDEATELGLAGPFAQMRQERVVYTVLENIGFAGSRSNAIDRSFFLDLLHNLPAIKDLRRFPDEVLEEILEILYKNQLHRNLLLKGFQRWALIALIFGREYYLERFKIPNLLGLPEHLDHLKMRICSALLSLDDKKLTMTAKVAKLTVEQVREFVTSTESILKDLATLFRWREGA